MVGGFDIQKDCEKLARTGNVHPGQVYQTHAGGLYYKQLFHAVIPVLDMSQQDQCEKLLLSALWTALHEADVQKYSTLAMPPIGNGRFRFPMEEIAKHIIRRIKKYLQTKTETHLRKIIMCDIDNPSTSFLNEFSESGALKERGNFSITLFDRQKPGVHARICSLFIRFIFIVIDNLTKQMYGLTMQPHSINTCHFVKLYINIILKIF